MKTSLSAFRALGADYLREAEETRQHEAIVLENQRLAHEQWLKEQQAYIELNNTFLEVQRGKKKLTIKIANRLRVLVAEAYKPDDTMMQNWWANEFCKLPNWNNV